MSLYARARDWLGVDRTVVSLSLARMGDGIGNSLLFVMIPLYVSRMREEVLHMPRPILIGILISVYGFASAIAQPFAAMLSDRIGHYKRIIQVGLLVLCAATASFVFAQRYLDLLGLRIVQGLGLALEVPPTLALLGMVTRRETRGSAMGFYTTLRMAGLAIGPLLGGYLHDHLGFDATFYAGAGVLLLGLVAVQVGVPHIAAPRPHEPRRFPLFDRSVLDRRILAAATATFAMATAFTLVTTLENQINSRLDIGAFAFSVGFSSLMVGRLIFQVPMGRLSDRLGRRPFVLGGLLALAPLTALLGEMSSWVEFVALRFAQGAAAGAVVAPSLAFVGDVAEQGDETKRSQQMSIVTVGFGLGVAFGPLVAGFLAIVSFSLPFIVDGALCLAAAVVVYFYMTEEGRG